MAIEIDHIVIVLLSYVALLDWRCVLRRWWNGLWVRVKERIRQNVKAPHEYDKWRYRERHLVEGYIGKIKHFRRVFARFDKLARRYPGFLQLTCALIWLR